MMKELIAIQAKLKAPKGQYNSFWKYKYRSAEDILEAVKPLLAEQGCLLTLTDEVVLVGTRYYVRAEARIENSEGLVVTNAAFAREDEDKKCMDGSQITGTASSYARKYALNGLFLIDDTKDADTDEYRKQTTAPATAPADDKSETQAVAEMYAVGSREEFNGCWAKWSGKVSTTAGTPFYEAAKQMAVKFPKP